MTQDELLVSVVTPTLNRGRYLEATLRSVRDQTYARVQHLVIDGGSVDDSIDILRRYEGSYDLQWISEPDGGMYDAVNKGLHMATGDVLAYLNSDDLYLPWTIDAVVRHLMQHPEAGLVFGDALNVQDETGVQRMIFQPPFDRGFIRRTGFLVQPAVFWRRAVYDAEGGFDQRFRYVADCEYWMRAALRWRFDRLDEVVAVERDHSGTQRSAQQQQVADEIRSLRFAYRDEREQTVLLRMRDRIRAGVWRRILLARFLVRALRARPNPSDPWGRFLIAGSIRVRWGSLLLSAIPSFGARHYGRAVFWNGDWRRDEMGVPTELRDA